MNPVTPDPVVMAWGILPEPAIMLIIGVGVFLFGGLLSRLLFRFKIISKVSSVLLIFCIVTSTAWILVSVYYDHGAAPYRFTLLLSVFLLFLYVLYVILQVMLPSQAGRTRASLPTLIRNLIIFVFTLMVLFVLILMLFPEVSLAPVFFTSGVVSIVIGLAVQDVLSNLLAGLVLSVDQPFKPGDWVHIGETEGEIIQVSWRTTKIRNFENDYIDLPNSLIAKSNITNHHTPTPIHMRKILVGVTYDTPPALAVLALTEAANHVNGVMTNPAPEIQFKDYLDSSLLYEVRAWIDYYGSYPVIESNLRKEIWYAFKRHDITIPFPIRDVNLRQIQETDQICYARLQGSIGLHTGFVYELDADRILIGRDPQNDICLPDVKVSKSHAEITRSNNIYTIRDLHSRHGTLLNGTAVTESMLQRGDEILIGSIKLTFETNLASKDTTQEKRPPVRKLIRKRPDSGIEN